MPRMRITKSTLLMTLFLAASASFAQSNPPGPSSVENIRFWVERSSVRIVVDIAGQVELREGELQDPSRFFIDISPARLSSTLKGKEWAVQSQPLQRIRVAQYDPSTVRVVLDGVAMRSVTSSTISNPTRVVLDVATSVPADPRESVSSLGLSDSYVSTFLTRCITCFHP